MPPPIERTPAPFRAAIAALAAGQPEQAVPLLEEAVRLRDGGPLAGLNLGMALHSLGRLREAEPLLHAAALALPSLVEPPMRLGAIAALRGETAAAAAWFQAALRIDPRHVPALAGLATLEEAAGRLEAAAVLLERARAAEPAEPELEVAWARVALALGGAETAVATCIGVISQRPAHAGAARLLVAALLAAGPAEAAEERLERQLAADPCAAAWPLALGLLRAQLGEPHRALPELRLAEALAPEEGEVQAELGRLLARLDRTEEAEQALRRAIAHRPADLDLRNLLGTLLWKGHRLGPMLALLDGAVAEFGPQAALQMNRALALNAQGRQEEALAAADSAVALSGSGLYPLVNRMAVLPYHPQLGTAAELLRAGRAIDAAAGPALPALHRRDRNPQRRLRVGVLSGGLGIHPVGWLTLAGLEALPEAAFELAVYAIKPRQDFIATRFRARAATWHEVAQWDEDRIAAAIAEDGVDILLEMGGYGEGGRPFVLHRRPAPVQVKWVGSQFGSTGLRSADWMVTDRWETPEGWESFYSERLLRLPDGYICYLPPPYAPDPVPLPALANGHVTFGCFNNLAKITPAVLAAWARILAALPATRLVVRTHALADTATLEGMRHRMRAAGLPEDRVALLAGVPHRQLLEAYNSIDISLDPFPYTGGLTVCEALWMGVPVLTLAGDSFAARHALSHLSNAGLPDWAVADVDAYVAEAVRRAQDLPALAALRQGLRAQVAASPLTDAARFGRNLGEALRFAWREWCAG